MAVSDATSVRQLEEHRAALTGHCYRMLGSAAEADDAVQETMVRAWRSLDRFEGRASLRTWLYRIATRVCLDAIGERARRARPMELGPAGSIHRDPGSAVSSSSIEPAGPSSIGRTRRARSPIASRHTRVAMRESQVRRDARPSKRSRLRHARTIVSCTASSASAAEPSMR